MGRVGTKTTWLGSEKDRGLGWNKLNHGFGKNYDYV